ncbi:MAG TPA: hypothetical protein VG096_07955 [Bryobacteraceae bacterium]|nr:hypothetical protein [Bryobacteraceae bacterium]
MAYAPATGSLRIHLADGSRQPLPDDFQTFLRMVEGHKPVASAFVNGSSAVFPGLPFSDNGRQRYTVFAHARYHRDALLFPVHLAKNVLVDAALMLVPENGRFRFDSLGMMESGHPLIRRVLGRGSEYHSMQESNPRHVATLLNLCAAMENMPLPDPDFRTPLHFDWQPEWDLTSPGRFWAWVDVRLMESLRTAGCFHSFAQQANPEASNPGIAGRVGPATASWKEIRFPVGNVRFSFHGHDRRTLDLVDPTGETRAVDCVMVEAEIDYAGDLVNVGLADVLPSNGGRETSVPELAYQLRWMAARQERLPEFNPPYGIESL